MATTIEMTVHLNDDIDGSRLIFSISIICEYAKLNFEIKYEVD